MHLYQAHTCSCNCSEIVFCFCLQSFESGGLNTNIPIQKPFRFLFFENVFTGMCHFSSTSCQLCTTSCWYVTGNSSDIQKFVVVFWHGQNINWGFQPQLISILLQGTVGQFYESEHLIHPLHPSLKYFWHFALWLFSGWLSFLLSPIRSRWDPGILPLLTTALTQLITIQNRWWLTQAKAAHWICRSVYLSVCKVSSIKGSVNEGWLLLAWH